MIMKKEPKVLRWNKYLNRACREVTGFAELLQRFERNILILGRSSKTFESYGRHILPLWLYTLVAFPQSWGRNAIKITTTKKQTLQSA